MNELILKDVTYLIKNKKVLTAVLYKVNTSFKLDTINILLGYSGSGKSTLLKAIAGLINISDGQIYLNNMRIDTLTPSDRNLSLMSQQFALYPHLNVFDNIAYPLKIAKLEDKEIKKRVIEISKILNIDLFLTRRIRQLSIGQQQRVALARALIKRPKILLLDEPFSNLDGKLKENLITDLKKLQTLYKLTIILVTHSIVDATRLGEYFVIMDNGTVVESGYKLDLIKNSESYFNKNLNNKEELINN